MLARLCTLKSFVPSALRTLVVVPARSDYQPSASTPVEIAQKAGSCRPEFFS
jgi:hypothetical protein